MKTLSLMAISASLLYIMPARAADPVPGDARQIQCVAALAIIASEQTRGVASAKNYPALQYSGARYAQIVGEGIMARTGQSKEQVRDAILAAVTRYQKSKATELPRAEVESCIAIMNRIAPPPPPPTLPICAALLTLAAKEVHANNGAAGDAKDLDTLAAVLDYRARETLRAEGKSGPEVDQAMDAAKTQAAINTNDDAADIDYGACLDMAKP